MLQSDRRNHQLSEICRANVWTSKHLSCGIVHCVSVCQVLSLSRFSMCISLLLHSPLFCLVWSGRFRLYDSSFCSLYQSCNEYICIIDLPVEENSFLGMDIASFNLVENIIKFIVDVTDFIIWFKLMRFQKFNSIQNSCIMLKSLPHWSKHSHNFNICFNSTGRSKNTT